MDMIQTSPPASEEMIKSAALHAAQALGYTQLKQKQAGVVEHFLSGQEVLAVLPTGYGKSLCYGCLPGAFDYLSGTTDAPASIVVVVTPLLAIMSDQVLLSSMLKPTVCILIRHKLRVRCIWIEKHRGCSLTTF